ncbi:peptide deformylase [Nisaea acidiphila]|uniref:Peptide deformylase n=2 Tax=Nisaea acidiphila TaxID=1862145 RepID=A0A9J7AZY4_9PROT|nr:peptide deformylase [Nisaea acidiphila]UUX51005.1 peptide deformylase [Nisaea acidiphila]
MGDPVLRQRAGEIEDPSSEEVAALAADMADSMAAAGGVGLAAPQIGISRRIIVFKVPADRATAETNDGPLDLQVLVNPVIEPLSGEMELGWEGCLSIPGLKGEVPRYRKILYRGYDLNGEKVLRHAEGFHARVIQHEVDHLDGILYPERMTDMRRFGYGEELLRAAAEVPPVNERGDGK